jgi:hypothetical protein
MMKRRQIMVASVFALVTFFLGWSSEGQGQTDSQPSPKSFRSLPKPSPEKVSGPEISMLIRTTLVSLHQANITGNYTVLRDLGSNSFRTINNPVRLGNIYGKLRESGIDLSPVVLLDPLLTKAPLIDANQVLIIEGFFPTEPLWVTFKMGFRFEFGGWRLLSLSVGAKEASAEPAGDTKKAVSGQKQAKGKGSKAPVPKEKPTAEQ